MTVLMNEENKKGGKNITVYKKISKDPDLKKY